MQRNVLFGGIFFLLCAAVAAGGALLIIELTGFGTPAGSLTEVTETAVAPPFYEVVFETDYDRRSQYTLNDPMMLIRNRPHVHVEKLSTGPHDVLGFRNAMVPNTVELVTIGDSQTYGRNVHYLGNWPSVAGEVSNMSVYNMATGGWGPLQYYYFIQQASDFKPKAVVVALYTGNDFYDCLSLPYLTEYWSDFRHADYESLDDFNIPRYNKFKDVLEFTFTGASEVIHTIMTPVRRLRGNARDNVGIAWGVGIARRIVTMIVEASRNKGFDLYFTIIPTKEYAFSQCVRTHGLESEMNQEYWDLLDNEEENIAELLEDISASGAGYIDVIQPLKDAACEQPGLYQEDEDGHPAAAGYSIIGTVIGQALTGEADSTATRQ